MSRNRKPSRGMQLQPNPKCPRECPDVAALRSPSQARARLAKWPLIVDKTPEDETLQVEIPARAGTARAPIDDREPALPRERLPDDRDLEDPDIRDGQLDGRPLLDGLHAKAVGQSAAKRRGPEDKVGPAAGISHGPGRWEGGQARDIFDIDSVGPPEAAVVTLVLVPLTHSFPVVEVSAQLPLRGPREELGQVVPPEPPALPDEAAAELTSVDILANRSGPEAQELGRLPDREEPLRGGPVGRWPGGG
jgi:hypothetical protein